MQEGGREFRARLRAPKPEYVLGAVVSQLSPHVSSRGQYYVIIRFSNYPLVSTFTEYDGDILRRLLEARGADYAPPQVGEAVNLDVKWRDMRGKVYPFVRIDLNALLESRRLLRPAQVLCSLTSSHRGPLRSRA